MLPASDLLASNPSFMLEEYTIFRKMSAPFKGENDYH